MNLLKKVTELCRSKPDGMDVNELAALCPEATRHQVVSAARNAYTRGRVNRMSRSGLGQATHTAPTRYGPPLPGQEEAATAKMAEAKKRGAQRVKDAPKAAVPLNRGRMPVNSVWALAS